MSDVKAAADYIHRALIAETVWRNNRTWPDWVEMELCAVTLAANEWAVRHDTGHAVTLDQVRHFDTMASGHIDWARKLPWYTAEAVYGLAVMA